MTHPNQSSAHAEVMQLVTDERRLQNEQWPGVDGWDKFPMEWNMIAQKQDGKVSEAQLNLTYAYASGDILSAEGWKRRYVEHLVKAIAVRVAWLENEILLEQDRDNRKGS